MRLWLMSLRGLGFLVSADNLVSLVSVDGVQNLCLVLSYDFSLSVKLLILFIYCFPDFVELSFCVSLWFTELP